MVTLSPASPGLIASLLADVDLELLARAAELADASAGLTQPHPNAGCILVSSDGAVVAETHQRAQVSARFLLCCCQSRHKLPAIASDKPHFVLELAEVTAPDHSFMPHICMQGTASAEVQAARAAGDAARGGTAYLNLETGDCHGDTTATAALLSAGVSRVVVGLPHPLEQLRGAATTCLRANGVGVDVLGVSHTAADQETEQAALEACLTANEVGRAIKLPACTAAVKAGLNPACICWPVRWVSAVACRVTRLLCFRTDKAEETV
jgi:diaminohydroxyphosphoribosylaminopyrimidine deaminase/5-amino-6-(5-phosphoribosylamino)uracil reductase